MTVQPQNLLHEKLTIVFCIFLFGCGDNVPPQGTAHYFDAGVASESVTHQPIIKTSDSIGDLELDAHSSRPQKGDSSHYPGNYEVSPSMDKTQVSGGDAVHLQVFYTGYGMCRFNKTYINVSAPVFERTSTIEAGVKIVKPIDGTDTNEVLQFQKNKTMFGYYNRINFHFAGLDPNGTWGYKTPFFDVLPNKNQNTIMTEMNIGGEAIVTGDLHVKRWVSGGDYSMNVYFTYFNGQEWKTSVASLPFHIMHWWETWWGNVILALIVGVVPVLFERIVLEKYSPNWLNVKPSSTRPEKKIVADLQAMPKDSRQVFPKKGKKSWRKNLFGGGIKDNGQNYDVEYEECSEEVHLKQAPNNND